MIHYLGILYFVWEDQSAAAYCIFHTAPISYIYVLGKYYTVLQNIYVTKKQSHSDSTTDHMHGIVNY